MVNIMYVRTKEGKIFNCFASESMGKPVYYIKDSLTNGFIDYNEAYKVSPNIIDIVQVGDYVNGEKVLETNCKWEYMDDDSDTGVNEVYDGLELQKGRIYFEYEIETVVTKEQYEQMAYKVEE